MRSGQFKNNKYKSAEPADANIRRKLRILQRKKPSKERMGNVTSNDRETRTVGMPRFAFQERPLGDDDER